MSANQNPHEHQNQNKTKKRHKPPFMLSFFRFVFKYIGRLFPALFGRWSYSLWFKTNRLPAILQREQKWLQTAKIEAVDLVINEYGVGTLPVMTYYWENKEQENAPLIMLLHGWTGRGSQMGAFAAPLLKEGFRVLSFDNHAHEKTPGTSSHLFLQSAVQCALAKKVAPDYGSIYGMVTHSFGGMVTPYSLQHGLEIQRIVCISPPSRFQYVVDRFSNMLHLPTNIRQYMFKRFTKEYGENLHERVSSTHTSVGLGHIPALIIHDEDDIDVPLSEGELLHQAWPNSKLIRTQGLGHRRILYDKEVVKATVDFLKAKLDKTKKLRK